MVDGLIALVVVLVAASAAGFALRARQGRFRPVQPHAAQSSAAQPDSTPDSTALPPARTGATDSDRDSAPQGRPPRGSDRLTAADLGAPLGERLTLVQFSTEYCAYCGPTRELLTEVARGRAGVAFVEIDAAERMDLTRRLHILSTPTVMLLDGAGSIASRAAGRPRKPELLAQIGAVLDRAVLDRAVLDRAVLDRAVLDRAVLDRAERS